MDEASLRALLVDVRDGRVDADQAVASLRRLPFEDLGFARIDHHRSVRQGFPEAIYAPGKAPAQCAAIVASMLAHEEGGPVILSRADARQVEACLTAAPGGEVTGLEVTGPEGAGPAGTGPADTGGSRPATVVWRPAPPRPERVVVVTAGTADGPVADECAAVLGALGLPPGRITDVGVAGLHRLLDRVDEVLEADAVVVVAGMEGALASVVGGLAACPVVAVPTSVGYGASLAGVTALLGMLASCAAGITVVGIDNGFGAAHAVARALPAGVRVR